MNMRATLLLLVSCFALAASKNASNRIIGGSVTTIDQYPFAAALLYSRTASSFGQFCGGTIINNRAVLTAAHCVYGDRFIQWRIRVGSSYANSGGVVHNTVRIITHPQYNWILDNDIAILHSQTAFSFNNNVAAASIAGANYNPADNEQVWAIGWGYTSVDGPSSEQLRHVQVWVVNQNVCRLRYAQILKIVTDNMLCAGWLDVGGRDACYGDSGGALLHNNVVVGVCSWGEECALARYPGVNARVSRYTAWIQANS